MIVRREHMPVRVHGHLQGGVPDKGLHRFGGERVKGIEPSYSAWKAAALPLSYTRARPINYHGEEAASTAMHGPLKLPWFLGCFVLIGPLTGADSLPIL